MTWDYIAGFLDGEGSIANKHRGFMISISQTNKRVLEDIRKLTGMGYIYKTRKRKKHWRDLWIYAVTAYKDVYKLLQRIENRLVVKKRLAQRAMKKLSDIFNEDEKRKDIRNFRIEEAKKLRSDGYSYREIGKRLNADWGYIRRLVKYN